MINVGNIQISSKIVHASINPFVIISVKRNLDLLYNKIQSKFNIDILSF